MKRVLASVVLFALAACVPACAAYQVNWMTGFEPPTYQPGPLSGQDGWYTPDNPSSTNEVGMEVVSGQARQLTGICSAAVRDMRYLNSLGETYYQGYAKFWVYDPGDIAGQNTYAHAGLHSSAGNNQVNYMFTAGINSGRSPGFWNFQWSYSYVIGDGLQSSLGTGYAFVPGPAAPRVYNAWSQVLISWEFRYTGADKSQGSATVKYYVNQSTVPNMTLDYDSNWSARWVNTNDVAGVFIGSLSSQSNPAAYDNVEFHADAVPEPSSLLAFGGGMVGLLGMIRMRR